MLGPVAMDTGVQQSLKDVCKRKRQDNAALPLWCKDEVKTKKQSEILCGSKLLCWVSAAC